jgi:hypothetical protein
MTKPSNRVAFVLLVKSDIAEKNRLVSWESAAQRANEPGDEIQSPKNSTCRSPLWIGRRTTMLIISILLEVLHKFLKLGYKIIKLFVRSLSSFRRFLS